MPDLRDLSMLMVVRDIYCYTCNDARVDPELSVHLATFGINIETQTKTEKSMTELVSLAHIVCWILGLINAIHSKSNTTSSSISL